MRIQYRSMSVDLKGLEQSRASRLPEILPALTIWCPCESITQCSRGASLVGHRRPNEKYPASQYGRRINICCVMHVNGQTHKVVRCAKTHYLWLY